MSTQDRVGYEWWDRMWKLQRYAFWRGEHNNVVKVPLSTGTHYDCHDVEKLVDEMQGEINRLNRYIRWLENERK